MRIAGLNFVRDTFVNARWEMSQRALWLRRPDSFVLHDVELQLSAWASDALRADIYRGTYEQNEREVLLSTLDPHDVVVEVGCGTGYITTLAARVAREVRSFDANAEMVDIARMTIARNGADADIRVGVLERSPTRTSAPFYVRDRLFTASRLEPTDGATRVDVPVHDFATACDGASYLLLDIEGAEITLLTGELPGIRAVCVECHPLVTPAGEITAMVEAMFEQGFKLDLGRSSGNVLSLSRTLRGSGAAH